jgi:hypothetical protein
MPNRGIYEVENNIQMEGGAAPEIANPPTTNRRVTLSSVLKSVKKAPKVWGLDWLEFHLNLEKIIIPDDILSKQKNIKFGEVIESVTWQEFTFIYKNSGNRFFYAWLQVWHYDSLMCEGFALGRGAANGIDANSTILKVPNSDLYIDDALYYLDMFLDCAQLVKFKKWVRVDVFMDMAVPVCQWIWPYIQKTKGITDFQLLHDQKFRFDGWNNEKAYPECITFGSMASNSQLQIYNKTQEIKKSGKMYIAALHKSTLGNFDTDIYRMEARLTDDYLDQINDLGGNIPAVFDWATLALQQVIHTKMTFLETDDSKGRRYWKKWKLNVLEQMERIARKTKEKNPKMGIWFAKIMLKKLYETVVSGKASKAEVQMIVVYIGDYLYGHQLQEWFTKSLSKWAKECPMNFAIHHEFEKMVLSLLRVSSDLNARSALSYLRSGSGPQDIDFSLYIDNPDEITFLENFWVVRDFCPF